MAGINHQPWKLAAAILLYLYILSPAETATPRGKGFSLKIIHPDSPDSPFYRGNLTDIQRLERLLNSSIYRARYIKSSILKSANTTTTDNFLPRPPIEANKDDHAFTVEVSIGTGLGYQTYHLELDTGSSLTWTKCKGISPSSPRDITKFKPALSPTYRKIPDDDSRCKGPHYKPNPGRKRCDFKFKYGDESSVEGELANETFTFKTAGGGRERVPQLLFGCANKATGAGLGVMGMGVGKESFAEQLAPYTRERFSYCLIPFGNPVRSGYLRFGDDIVMKGPFQKTPISTFSPFDYYYLNLEGISFNGVRVNIPHDAFDPGSDGKGGVLIDSGSAYSYLVPKAYEPVKAAIVQYFDSAGFTRIYSPVGYLEVCYKSKPNLRINNLPGMTFHFAGVGGRSGATADFQAKGEQVFEDMKDKEGKNDIFCWAMVQDTDPPLTIIGAYQQYNTRFTYDIKNKELQFAPEDCAGDAKRS